MKPSIYIETTVVSYLAAWPSRDLIRAAQQQITRDWWNTQREQFDLFASELVIIEASAGDPKASSERLAVLQGLPLLDVTDRALDLADALLAASALPPIAQRDAQHIAVAAVHGIDFLLTWNCRHLANAILRDKIEEVCEALGLAAPKLCTPEELPGDQP